MAARLRFRLRQLVHDLSTGMLLRPGIIAAAIAVNGPLLVELEAHGVIPRWEGGGWFLDDDPASALAVLGAIAGSMMAVISIVYSVMLVALTMASVQFSPRILGNLIRDQVSQRTLGVFLGTFVYCLLVMRSVRTDPDWVGTWAVAGGSLLGLACLVFLVHFLHHIANRIQVNHLVERVARHTREVFAETFGCRVATLPVPPATAIAVEAPRDGYLQLVDHDGLAALARAADLTVHVAVQAGDYVTRGAPIAHLEARGKPIAPWMVRACCNGFDLGPVRTMQQDVAYGIRQLVDVGLKALSAAYNDPSTAKTCVDWLGALVAEIAEQGPRDLVIADGDVVRVAVPQPGYDALVDLAFNELRQYARMDLGVSIRLLAALSVAGRRASDAQRHHLREQAELVKEGLDGHFLPTDRRRFDDAHARAMAALA